MKLPKHSVILILMYSSIALLLILQFLWIRSAYTRAFEVLQKDTDNILRTTIISMRDTLIQRAFESMPTDSALKRMRQRRRAFRDVYEEDDDAQGNVQSRRPVVKFFAPPEKRRDSVRWRNPGAHAHDLRERRDFLFRLGPDSLKIDSIASHFARAMTKAGYNMPFKVYRVRRNNKRDHPQGSFVSDVVRLNPQYRYAVLISGYYKSLARGILPQASFSLFLTLTTVVAFYVLYKSIRTQQKLVQLKNDFISNITHELKTPITTVSVALEALKNFQVLQNPALSAEYLTIAQNELGRLTLLTDKILKTSVYDDHGVSLQMTQVDVAALVDAIVVSFRLVFEKNGAAVSVEKKGNNFTVSGDRDHLTNVIYNLIDNALKYTPSSPVLTLLVSENSASVALSVGDNGPGIPVAWRKKIFEKFFRIPTGDVHNVKGYGLGLSYVESVARGHGGSIRMEENAGGGSLFIFTLPKQMAAIPGNLK